MKKLFVNCLSLALGMLVLFSCKDNGGKTVSKSEYSSRKTIFTPVSSGRPYEMLVVIDKAMWERPAGRALFNVLDTDVPGPPNRSVLSASRISALIILIVACVFSVTSLMWTSDRFIPNRN